MKEDVIIIEMGHFVTIKTQDRGRFTVDLLSVTAVAESETGNMFSFGCEDGKMYSAGGHLYQAFKDSWMNAKSMAMLPGLSSAVLPDQVNSLKVADHQVSFEDLTCGSLFLHKGCLAMKSQYRSYRSGAEITDSYSSPDAYIHGSGERFWAGQTSHRDLSDVMVIPVEIAGLEVEGVAVG